MAEGTDKQSEEPKVKWASKAYAFLSLFSRLRNRLSGLLMLELGWGLLVKLIFSLSDNPAPHSPSAAQAAAEVSAFKVFLIGALAIALYWLVSSGCWKIVYFALARPGRPFASNMLVGLTVLLGLASLPLYVIAFLVEATRFLLWQKRHYPDDKIAEIQTSVAEPELRRMYAKEQKAAGSDQSSFENWSQQRQAVDIQAGV